MKKILLIINPVAGKLQTKTALFDALTEFCKNDYEVTTVLTQRRGHGRELAAGAQSRGFDAVVCAGGDGTLNEAISGIINSNSTIPLGYIPCGSTNDFAQTLQVPLDYKEAARRIIEGNTKTIDIGSFGEDKYFSYIASFGAFTAASYNAPQELKNVLGHFAYILEGIRDVGSIRPLHVKATIDGKEIEGDYLFGAVSNTTSVGGIVKLKDNLVNLNDGMFEITLIKTPQTAIELNDIILGIASSDFSGEMFSFTTAKEASFSFSGDLSWTLDGEEAKTNNTVNIKNIHNAVSIFG